MCIRDREKTAYSAYNRKKKMDVEDVYKRQNLSLKPINGQVVNLDVIALRAIRLDVGTK